VTLLFLTASTFVAAAFSRDKRQQHGYGTDCLNIGNTKSFGAWDLGPIY
jgi:hypothetical protein